MPKIVQIAVAAQAPEVDKYGAREKAEEVVVTALCDDGSAWLIRPDESNASWARLPEIPIV
jgi:hypothetical protein